MQNYQCLPARALVLPARNNLALAGDDRNTSWG
jgi:hypothetical protein